MLPPPAAAAMRASLSAAPRACELIAALEDQGSDVGSAVGSATAVQINDGAGVGAEDEVMERTVALEAGGWD